MLEISTACCLYLFLPTLDTEQKLLVFIQILFTMTEFFLIADIR